MTFYEKKVDGTSTSLLHLIVRNAISQTGGRIILTIIRFGVAVIIARRTGFATFGQYALVLSIVGIAEWIADFGQSDIAVRDLSSAARPWRATLGALASVKVAQGGVAALVAWAVVSFMGYSDAVVGATLIASLAIIQYAFVLVYRAEFRAQMQMDKDVGAEILSAVALAVSTWQVTRTETTLETLVLCYVGARTVYLLAAVLLANRWLPMSFGRQTYSDAMAIFVAALPIGAAGLMVSAYDAMDAIALTRWSNSTEVGVFTIVTRILMMAVIVVQSLSVAVFPVLSAQWRSDRAAFVRTTQATIDCAMIFGGTIFCATWCGAGGIAQYFGQDPIAITLVLQLLSWAILARVLVTCFSPMVVISGRQIHTLWMTGIVVLAKWLALVWFVPLAGAVGVATSYLLSEIVVGLLPTILLCQFVAGVNVAWDRPLKSLGVAALIVGLARWYNIEASLVQGIIGALIFVVLASLTGAIRADELKVILHGIAQRRQPGNLEK